MRSTIPGGQSRLGHLGRLAVDDAEAGFASLCHIVRLAPQLTKLDISITRASFVRWFPIHGEWLIASGSAGKARRLARPQRGVQLGGAVGADQDRCPGGGE